MGLCIYKLNKSAEWWRSSLPVELFPLIHHPYQPSTSPFCGAVAHLEEKHPQNPLSQHQYQAKEDEQQMLVIIKLQACISFVIIQSGTCEILFHVTIKKFDDWPAIACLSRVNMQLVLMSRARSCRINGESPGRSRKEREFTQNLQVTHRNFYNIQRRIPHLENY